MIEFRINGESLDLPPDFVLSLKRKSPIYFGGNKDSIPGSYTIPSSIDATDHNRKLLSAPEYLNNWDEVLELDNVKLFIDSNFLMSGKLYVSVVNPSSYKIQFVSGAGAYSQMKETSLKTYVEQEVTENFFLQSTFGTFDNMIATIQANPNDYPYMAHLTYFKDGDQTLGYYSLSLYVEWILNLICKYENLTLEEDVFDDEMKNLLLFENYVLNENFFDGFFGGSYVVRPKDYCPNMYASNFLNSFAKNFCLGIDFDPIRNKLKIFKHSGLIDRTAKDWTTTVRSNIEKNIKPTQFNIKELDYEVQFDLYEDIDFSFNELDPVVLVDDLPAQAFNGDVCFVYSKAAYYEYSNTDWNLFDNFQSLRKVNVNDKGAEIKSNISTLYMIPDIAGALHALATGKAYTYVFIVTPAEVNNPVKDSAEFLFYRGTINDNNGNPYALVSNDIHDQAGNELGTQSLKWYGDNGLYNKRWKPWIDYINNSIECNVTIKPSMEDIFNLDMLEKVKIWDDHSGGYHYFFWKEFNLVVDMNKIRESKQTLVQIRN